MRARALLACALLAAGACDEGFRFDDGFCDRHPGDPTCPPSAGSAGVSGSGGGGAAGASGNAGVGGAAGLGGGGTGGSGPCVSDAACASENGTGSLCVGETCTAPSTSCTKATLAVVPDLTFAGALAADVAGACFYRALGPSLAAAAQNGAATTRVVAYAAAVEGPAVVPSGVRLEGRATTPATLVTLTAGSSGGAAGSAGASGAGGAGGGGAPALVTLGDGAALAGFALDAAGAVGVRVAAGKASLEGPLELRGGKPALSVEGTATATVAGKAEAAVLFTGNVRGVGVGPTGGLTMTGDKSATGLVLTGTNGGAAVLVEAGTNTPEVTLIGIRLANNTGSDVLGGTGAVEVRPGRKVTLTDNVFENNRNGLRLNGQGASESNDFANISLGGNKFVVGASAGVAICGADFLASTTLLRLGTGNELPSGTVDTQADCAALTQQGNCNGGATPAQRDVGYTNTPFVVQCPSLPPRMANEAP